MTAKTDLAWCGTTVQPVWAVQCVSRLLHLTCILVLLIPYSFFRVTLHFLDGISILNTVPSPTHYHQFICRSCPNSNSNAEIVKIRYNVPCWVGSSMPYLKPLLYMNLEFVQLNPIPRNCKQTCSILHQVKRIWVRGTEVDTLEPSRSVDSDYISSIPTRPGVEMKTKAIDSLPIDQISRIFQRNHAFDVINWDRFLLIFTCCVTLPLKTIAPDRFSWKNQFFLCVLVFELCRIVL